MRHNGQAALLKRATQLWGEKFQREMVIEECGELIYAIASFKSGIAIVSEVPAEVADVLICTNQLAGDLGAECIAELEKSRVAEERERGRTRVSTSYLEDSAVSACSLMIVAIRHFERGRITFKGLEPTVIRVITAVNRLAARIGAEYIAELVDEKFARLAQKVALADPNWETEDA